MSQAPPDGFVTSVGEVDNVTEAMLLQDFLPKATLELSSNVPAGEKVEKEVDMPFPGVVTEVYLRFPDGVDSQVGINIRSETAADRVFPSNPEADFVAFNNVSRDFNVGFQEAAGGEITATFDSISGTPHFINVILTAVDTRPLDEVLSDGST